MFCQSVMYFQTPANSLKFTPPLLSLSNMDMIDRTVTGLKGVQVPFDSAC
uniref:Uncharacterized protein n=1 Tax=Anguilla anguilla TaxID=7936 RepID=A0A0E9XMM7_ANGAN